MSGVKRNGRTASVNKGSLIMAILPSCDSLLAMHREAQAARAGAFLLSQASATQPQNAG